MDRIRRLAVGLALVTPILACGRELSVATSSPSPVPAPTPTDAPPPKLPPPTAQPARTPGGTPRVGGCTSPAFTTRQMLDRYFSLTTSGDSAAVMDCFAKPYRDLGDIEASARMWASSGPLTRVVVKYVDTVNGCDRYATEFDFAIPDPYFPNPWTIFYTVGPENGVARIFDGGTGLAAPELVRTVCR